MHVLASEEESNFNQAKELSCRNNPVPASFGIRPTRLLYLSDGRYPKEPETAYATVLVRRPAPRYTSPTRARKGFILGASDGY